MDSVSQKLIELNMALRYACNVDDTTSAVTLQTKLLHLLSQRKHTFVELLTKLCMVKSNLTLLCNKAVKENLITKHKMESDKRVVCYTITEKGLSTLNNLLTALENKFRRILTTNQEYNVCIAKLDNVIDILSYL